MIKFDCFLFSLLFLGREVVCFIDVFTFGGREVRLFDYTE